MLGVRGLGVGVGSVQVLGRALELGPGLVLEHGLAPRVLPLPQLAAGEVDAGGVSPCRGLFEVVLISSLYPCRRDEALVGKPLHQARRGPAEDRRW